MLRRPIISEKSMLLTKEGLYTFEISSKMTKEQITKIVEEKFKVNVQFVRTINIRGKKKTQRTRKGYFTTPSLKKAIVKVKKGQKIPIFEAPEEKEDVKITTAEGQVLTTIKEKKSLLRGTK